MFFKLFIYVPAGSSLLLGPSPVAAGRGSSLAVAPGLRLAVAALVTEHSLGSQASAVAARGFRSCSSEVLEPRVSSCGPRA